MTLTNQRFLVLDLNLLIILIMNKLYIVDPNTGDILAEIDRKLWEYYYQPKLSEDIQPNLYFDEEEVGD